MMYFYPCIFNHNDIIDKKAKQERNRVNRTDSNWINLFDLTQTKNLEIFLWTLSFKPDLSLKNDLNGGKMLASTISFQEIGNPVPF